MVISAEKKRALAEEIARILKTPRQQEDEITSGEYAEFSGCSKRQAYDRLMKAVIAGQMTKRKVLIGSNWNWAFKMVDPGHTVGHTM